MGLLYGRAGRLTAENGGFRPGQWFNCSDPAHGRKCVLDAEAAALPASEAADACAQVDAAAAAAVIGLENRPNSYGEHDHTPSGEPSHRP